MMEKIKNHHANTQTRQTDPRFMSVLLTFSFLTFLNINNLLSNFDENILMIDRLKSAFITGLLIFVPLATTAFIVYWSLTTVESLLRPFFYKTPYYFPGFSLVILLVTILALGFAGTHTIGQKIIFKLENSLKKIPLIRTVYSGVREAIRALLTTDVERLRGVVLLEYPRKGVYAIGFTSGSRIGEACRITGEKLVNVFIPTSPNPTSGLVILVPERELIYLDMSVEDAMKIIISGGFSEV